ncbi:uncharacterized protein VTP21DRAFT_6237 [Calcarisporiella thermophila]|uniref:uncharacterized protein n=1 Tax=Calcarisporiella thermophila TaxID=911321 RepID=UPI003743F245
MSDNANRQQNEPTKTGSTFQSTIGKVKEKAGNLFGNSELSQKGTAEQEHAAAQHREADVHQQKREEEERPSRTSANYNTAVGMAKEEFGQLSGSKETAHEGAQQRREGQVEHERKRQEDWMEGAKEHAKGTIQSGVNRTIGDDEAQAQAQQRKEAGREQMQVNQ